MKKRIFTINFLWLVLLVVGVIVSIFLAIIPLRSQTPFYFDQARDAFEASSILNGDIKIQGPSSDIPGVHHGVLWYYILAFPYFVAQGDPQIVATIFFIFSFLTVPLCGYAAHILFQNKKITFVSMLLYAFSPLFQALTRWLSNPLLTIYVMPFFFVFLWKYFMQQNKKYALYIGICMGLLIQSDFAFGVLLFIIPFYLLFYRIKPRFIEMVYFFLGLLLISLSFFVAEIKFKGKIILSMINFLSTNHTTPQSLITNIERFISKIIDLFAITTFPFPKIIIGIMVLLLVFILYTKRVDKEKKGVLLLLFWLSNIFIFQLFSSGILQSFFIFAPSLVAVVILTSYLLVALCRSKLLLIMVILIIICSQFFTSYKWISSNFSPLSVQRGMNLADQKRIIDYTYTSLKKEPFSIYTITNPLYINTTWAYLYQFYGKKKYGYMPLWIGKSQKGYLGNLPEQGKPTKYEYLIIEPGPGIPDFYINLAIDEANQTSSVIQELPIGNFIVQKREKKDYIQSIVK